MKKNNLIIFVFLLLIISNIQAGGFTSVLASYRPAEKGKVVISLKPDKKDWLYDLNQEAVINIELINTSVKNATINYELGLEMMSVVKRGTIQIVNGKAVFNAGTIDIPGFLRCTFTGTIDGVSHKEIVTLGFAPHKIEPTVEMPEDFMEFWQNSITEARKIPSNYRLILLPDKSTALSNVYQLDFDNHMPGSKFYAVVSIPKKTGKHPAVIRLPGAGYSPNFGGAGIADEKNIIVISVYIHEYPVTMNTSFYDNLGVTVLSGYSVFGIQNRDTHYFKRIIIGCIKTIDCLFEFPEFDGKNLIAHGSSQGGALSTITTALDKRIKYFTALFTGMSDQTGYLYGRAGGWPHYFRGKTISTVNPDAFNAARYYDVANFVRYIDVPGFFSWGYNDITTPATSIYASYNQLNIPKETLIILNGEHRTYSEQTRAQEIWQDQVLANLTSDIPGLNNQNNSNDKVFVRNSVLHLQFEKSNTHIEIFNMKGHTINSETVRNKDVSIKLPKGAYLVRINEKSFKILI